MHLISVLAPHLHNSVLSPPLVGPNQKWRAYSFSYMYPPIGAPNPPHPVNVSNGGRQKSAQFMYISSDIAYARKNVWPTLPPL